MTNDCPAPGTLPHGRRSVALRPRARTLHPHLGTTLWIVGSRAVDERPQNRGQPVDEPGTTRVGSRLSTAAARCPRARPDRHPQAATPWEHPRRRPSTPSTAPVSTAGSLPLFKKKKNKGVDGSGTRPVSPSTGART